MVVQFYHQNSDLMIPELYMYIVVFRHVHKTNFRGGVHKKIYNNQYLSVNDDINKLHNY